MAVYYKFKSAKDYDSIPIEGQFISVGNLKERIFESKHLGRGTDFDLMVANAQTNEEYVDEAAMIPKNTSVLIRRVPGRPRKPIVTEPDEPKVLEDKVEDAFPPSSTLVTDPSTMKYPEESEWDEFGNDLYTIPEVLPSQSIRPAVDLSPADHVDEDSKIKALIDTPALDWNRQAQDAYGSGRGYGRGMGGRMVAGRGFGRGGFERKTPPAGYVCHRCKVPGHFIQHCPTNGDPNYDIKRVKPPTGIPKSMLMATPDGSYALPSGAVAVLKPNEAAFEKEIEGLPTTRPVSDLPPELRCPLCKEVMKDAVLTSKCCFRSFCDKCIRDYIISKSMCVCGATSILADDLLPNKTLRETISRILESTTSSTENAGSLVLVQDMESARPGLPKVISPTHSAASKGESKASKGESKGPPVEHSLEAESASRVKAVNMDMNSSDKKVAINVNVSDATPESTNAKEAKSPESAPAPPEDAQEKLLAGEQGKKKKKKKARLPGSAVDMQWRNYQDMGVENFGGMPLAASSYNPYWAGGMPMGMDPYMAAPLAGAMPFMGYAPGPFDVPFGGAILPQDPFVAPGYMMPAVPRDLSELAIGSMAMNMGPPVMRREEMEARRADLRRKREFERLTFKGQGGQKETREAGGGVNEVTSVKSKPRSAAQSSGAAASALDRRSAEGQRLLPYQLPRLQPGIRRRGWAEQEEAEVLLGAPSPAQEERPSDQGGPRTGENRTASDSYRSSAAAAPAPAAARRGYEHESSEEEYHFKRRPSRREADSWELMDEGRHSRGSREREPHSERPTSKRR
uniref:DWNN domain-containing protein n=1 Tax=Ananas comosus var. bracteatus TaxID=296719 RepID=A0A6V7QSV6_ANACO